MSKITSVPNISTIVVTHNSEKYLELFWQGNRKELNNDIYIINSNADKLNVRWSNDFKVVEAGANVGFSAANNIGLKQCLKSGADFFLIINPDICLPSGWLSSVIDVINDSQYVDVGVFTVPLLGYDFKKNRPNGFIDSLGVDHTWYGRWFDLSQGDDAGVLDGDKLPYEVAAACGALMLIRRHVVTELINRDGYVFNESFFMYKEDIELSIRIRSLGKKIMILPSAKVFHCRGWAKDRAASPYWARVMSARNEFNMHLKHRWCFLPYSLAKYLYVKFIERITSGSANPEQLSR